MAMTPTHSLRIRVEIGNRRFDQVYALYLTNAPVAYDYSGVLRVWHDVWNEAAQCDCDIVAIPAANAEYQTTRYRSGLYAVGNIDPQEWEWCDGLILKRILDSIAIEGTALSTVSKQY